MKQRREFELETVEGLVALARSELDKLPSPRPFGHIMTKNAIRFAYDGDLRLLLTLKLAQAVYDAESYPIPRPRALLGDMHFRRWVAQIERVRALHPTGTFMSFHIAAAGSESSVMARIKAELGAVLRIPHADEGGDLLIRIVPDDSGWRTLVRLTPRPLATRAWRVHNYEGALNATVAHALALLTEPNASDVFVNLGAGSGSILIERCAAAPLRAAYGVERDAAVIALARGNIAAADVTSRHVLLCADMGAVPLPDACADALAADLPFGQRVGSHTENVALYPAALAEAARIAKPGALFAAITHEVRLMERVLAAQPAWERVEGMPVVLRGLHPRIYVLRRR